MNRKFPALLIALAAAAIAGQTQAHHAFSAEFDSKRPIIVEGQVTKIQLVNPHSWIYLDVKDKKGAVQNWGFEFGTPTTLRKNGIVKADIPIGSKIHIKGYKAKNGGNFGYSDTLTLADGRRVKTGGAADAPGDRRP